MEKWYRKGLELVSEIQNISLAPSELAFWFLGQCGFVFRYADKTVMIDPVLNDIVRGDGRSVRHYPVPFSPDALQVDYVLCTHGHIDHLAGETVKGIAAAFPNARFIIPVGCKQTALDFGLPESSLVYAFDGCDLSLDGLRVSAFSEAHPEHVLDENDPAMALGYCAELGGIRIFHLGDTYLTERLLQSLEAMPSPHILLPPINGDDRFRARRDLIGNMEPEEAAALAAHLNADLTVPTHYDMIQGNSSDPLRFAAELMRRKPNAKWHLPRLGEMVIYRK